MSDFPGKIVLSSKFRKFSTVNFIEKNFRKLFTAEFIEKTFESFSENSREKNFLPQKKRGVRDDLSFSFDITFLVNFKYCSPRFVKRQLTFVNKFDLIAVPNLMEFTYYKIQVFKVMQVGRAKRAFYYSWLGNRILYGFLEICVIFSVLLS